MKKIVGTILFLVLISSLFAQQISVKSFRKLQNDMDARLSETALKDFNGEQSAIIKVVTTQTGFTFDCGSIGIVKTINKPSEIWVYVPHGAKRISIFHDKLGQIRDWIFTEPIEKSTVYELVLTTAKVITTLEETIESQWLVINPEPTDASVYIDDVFVKTGTCQIKKKPGTYTYRVEAPLYHTEAGKVEITDNKKEISTILKPAFGYVTVNTEPEKDAKVVIDGKILTTNTPCKSEALASGVHTVQVIKEMFQPSAQKVTIADGQTALVNFKLEPTFAEISINAPTDATLYINNEKKATGNWSGRLSAGVYNMEARLDKHRPAKQDIELTAGDVKTVNLQPTPIYGSLDIITTPVGANISINGKDNGTTPNTISKLLIGDYTIQLSKTGYGTINKKVYVVEGKERIVNETLSNGRTVTINSIPSGAKLIIDEKEVGITPYYGTLTFGNHILRATIADNVDEKRINLSETGENNYELNLGRYVSIDADIKHCQVYIDNKSVGFTPYKGIVSLGRHTIKIIHDGQQFERNTIVDQYNSETNVRFDIKESINIEKMSGPANLFLSVLVPGLGDWNVTKREHNGVGKMLWSYGLILSGVGCKLFSDSEYKQYHIATDQTAMDTHYTNANDANYAFYGLVATGLAVWVYDIIWVANKGSQNTKERDKNKLSLIYDPSNQMLGLNYKIKF